MSDQRIDGYLSRSISVYRLNGEVMEFKLHIIRPVVSEIENPQSGTESRLRIFMSDFDIIPYTHEIPYIIYVDSPIIVKELSTRMYELTALI